MSVNQIPTNFKVKRIEWSSSTKITNEAKIMHKSKTMHDMEGKTKIGKEEPWELREVFVSHHLGQLDQLKESVIQKVERQPITEPLFLI